MSRFIRIPFICFISLSLSSCSTLPIDSLAEDNMGVHQEIRSSNSTNFTSENIMKVRQGMSSNEILAMFGEPKSVDVDSYSTTWRYTYEEMPFFRARFRFSGEHDSLTLDDFSIDRL